MARSDQPASCRQHHFTSASEHVSPHIVEVWAGHTPGASDNNIICRVCTITACSVRAKEVIPPVTILQVCCFTVNGNINGFIPLHALSCLRIKFYETDKPEIGSVGAPEPSIIRIKEKARIDCIIIFNAVGLGNQDGFRILEIGRLRVERLIPHCKYSPVMSATQATACSAINYKITIAYFHCIRCGSASRPYCTAVPYPAIFRYQTASACSKGVILPVTLHDG